VAKRINVRFRSPSSTLFFWLMALAGLALAFTVATLPALARNHSLSRQLQRLQQENTRLRRQLQHLKLQEQALRTDPVYNEALARRELGLLRPGERVLATAPPEMRDLPSLSFASAVVEPGGSEPVPLGSGLSRLGLPGRYLARVLQRLTFDRAARRDGYLLSIALLTAAFLLFGQPDGRMERPASLSSR